MNRIGNFAAAMVVVFCVLTPAVSSADSRSLEQEVERGMAMWHVPGMAVAVVSSDSVELQKGFGVTTPRGGATVDEHTLFAIASTTKAMIVAGLLMLADEGELSLDDAVIQHIPELHLGDPALAAQLSIRDLLAHRTGLPSTDLWTFLMDMPLEEQVRRLALVDSAAPVRTRLIYQNTMYELAGLIIERTSGKRWDRFLTERLWYPIGMRETYGARGQIPSDKTHALPHSYFNDKLAKADWDLDKDNADAAGSVWSSIHDMSLWAQFLLRGAKTAEGEQLISDESLADMFEPQHLAAKDDFYWRVEVSEPHWRSYGLGWFQRDFQGRMINFHTGSLSGLIAIIGLDRDNDKAIVVLGNQDHAEMRHALLWYAMDLSDQGRDWNQEIFDLVKSIDEEEEAERAEMLEARIEGTEPSLPLADYVGNYRNEVIGDFTVDLIGGKLRVMAGRHSFAVSHWHLDIFEISKKEWDFEAFMSFSISPAGDVATMNLFGMDFHRVPDE